MSSPGRGSPVSLPSPHCRTWAAFPQVIQKHCLQRGTKNLWKTQTCLFPYNSAERQANRLLKLTGSALFFLKKKEENPLGVSYIPSLSSLVPRHQNYPFWKGPDVRGRGSCGCPPRAGGTVLVPLSQAARQSLGLHFPYLSRLCTVECRMTSFLYTLV